MGEKKKQQQQNSIVKTDGKNCKKKSTVDNDAIANNTATEDK